MIDDIISFIKTERECCNLFLHSIFLIEDNNMNTLLSITGPKGSKRVY